MSSSVLVASNCNMCEGEGYFGDFGPGIYPLPCPNCIGTGMDGIATKDATDKLTATCDVFYTRIDKQTERRKVAAESFAAGIELLIAESPDKVATLCRKRSDLLRRLGTFPMEYLPAESECLREGWAQAEQLVDPAFKPLVHANSKKVVGRNYQQNALMEMVKAPPDPKVATFLRSTEQL